MVTRWRYEINRLHSRRGIFFYITAELGALFQTSIYRYQVKTFPL
jgi:hypothetical protein